MIMELAKIGRVTKFAVLLSANVVDVYLFGHRLLFRDARLRGHELQ